MKYDSFLIELIISIFKTRASFKHVILGILINKKGGTHSSRKILNKWKVCHFYQNEMKKKKNLQL